MIKIMTVVWVILALGTLLLVLGFNTAYPFNIAFIGGSVAMGVLGGILSMTQLYYVITKEDEK